MKPLHGHQGRKTVSLVRPSHKNITQKYWTCDEANLPFRKAIVRKARMQFNPETSELYLWGAYSFYFDQRFASSEERVPYLQSHLDEAEMRSRIFGALFQIRTYFQSAYPLPG